MLSGFVSRGPVVGETEVAAFERWCGFCLPPDYRRFLLEQNGGERASVLTPERAMEVDAWTREYRFFSLGAAAGLTVEDAVVFGNKVGEAWPRVEYDLAVQARWLWGDGGPLCYPPDLLPVAIVYHHDLLLLRLNGPEAGGVLYCWNPDGYFEWHCGQVAESLAELLRNFESQDWA
jgi:hypothetical protein